MAVLKADDSLKKSPEIIWKKVDAEAVLLNLDRGEYVMISEVGAEIWERLGGNKSIKEIASSIAKKYEIDDKRALTDTVSFIKKLLKHGMLKPTP